MSSAHLLLVSSRAASSISTGTIDRPERKISAQNGVHCQTSIAQMAVKAPFGLPSQSDGRRPNEPEPGVGDAKVEVEDQAAEKTDDRVGRGERNDERDPRDRAKEVQARLMEKQGDREPEHDLDRHHADEEKSRPPKRFPEGGIGKDSDVIVESDERESRRGTRVRLYCLSDVTSANSVG